MKQRDTYDSLSTLTGCVSTTEHPSNGVYMEEAVEQIIRAIRARLTKRLLIIAAILWILKLVATYFIARHFKIF